MTRGASYAPAGGHWYIPGRTGEVVGDFLMNECEFHSISTLIPLVSTLQRVPRGGVMQFAVACLNRADAETVALLLAAIRGAAYYNMETAK